MTTKCETIIKGFPINADVFDIRKVTAYSSYIKNAKDLSVLIRDVVDSFSYNTDIMGVSITQKDLADITQGLFNAHPRKTLENNSPEWKNDIKRLVSPEGRFSIIREAWVKYPPNPSDVFLNKVFGKLRSYD